MNFCNTDFVKYTLVMIAATALISCKGDDFFIEKLDVTSRFEHLSEIVEEGIDAARLFERDSMLVKTHKAYYWTNSDFSSYTRFTLPVNFKRYSLNKLIRNKSDFYILEQSGWNIVYTHFRTDGFLEKDTFNSGTQPNFLSSVHFAPEKAYVLKKNNSVIQLLSFDGQNLNLIYNFINYRDGFILADSIGNCVVILEKDDYYHNFFELHSTDGGYNFSSPQLLEHEFMPSTIYKIDGNLFLVGNSSQYYILKTNGSIDFYIDFKLNNYTLYQAASIYKWYIEGNNEFLFYDVIEKSINKFNNLPYNFANFNMDWCNIDLGIAYSNNSLYFTNNQGKSWQTILYPSQTP